MGFWHMNNFAGTYKQFHCWAPPFELSLHVPSFLVSVSFCALLPQCLYQIVLCFGTYSVVWFMCLVTCWWTKCVSLKFERLIMSLVRFSLQSVYLILSLRFHPHSWMSFSSRSCVSLKDSSDFSCIQFYPLLRLYPHSWMSFSSRSSVLSFCVTPKFERLIRL